MKTFFTLLTLIGSLFTATTSLQAQISEGFENTSGLTYYQANGWSFYGADFDYTSQITQAGSIYVIPSTSTVNNNSNSNTTQVVTPYVNLTNGGRISFNYKLAVALGNNQDRVFTISLYDGTTKTSVSSFTITGTTPAGVVQTSPTISVPAGSGSRRVVIDFTGRGDGNSYLYFDNLSVQPNTQNIGTTLPIQLLSFNGTSYNKKALLTWMVNDNETGDYFEVQKSSTGKNFTSIATLFTNDKKGVANYQFEESLEGSAYYRILIVNKDRSIDYTKIVLLKEATSITKEQDIKLLQNPVQSALHFSFFSTIQERNTVAIYSLAGTRVYTNNISAAKGQNIITLDLHVDLPKGTYILEVLGSTQRRTIKITR